MRGSPCISVPLLCFALVLTEVIATEPLHILHIGDSFSAGNGARDENFDNNYEGPDGCWRSPTNWGQQLADLLGADSYRNRACSGATLNMVLEEAQTLRPFTKVDGQCPEPPYNQGEFFVETASPTTCTMMVQPQIDSIDDSVDLLLITVGANDFQFEGAVRSCFGWPARDAAQCQSRIDYVNDSTVWLGFEGNLRSALQTIGGRLKSSAIVLLVAYPHITLDIPYTASIDGDTIELTDQLRDAGNIVEGSQQDGVLRANIFSGRDFVYFYNGTKALFAGREPHPGPFTENPDRWIWEIPQLDITFPTQDVYHPRPEGHENLASAVYQYILNEGILPSRTLEPNEVPSMPPSATPSEQPNPSPDTPPPMATPTPAPVAERPAGGGFFCFSSLTTVDVKDKGVISIAELELGDMVRTEGYSYSKVYSFGHRDPLLYADFVQIQFDEGVVELTSEHMLYVNGVMKNARSVVVGDTLTPLKGAQTFVRRIATVRRQGVFGPFTESGTIGANGVVASNYITALDIVGQHDLWHSAMAPIRWWNQWEGSVIDAKYATDSMTHPVASFAPFLMKLGESGICTQYVVAGLFSPVFGALYVVDTVVQTWCGRQNYYTALPSKWQRR